MSWPPLNSIEYFQMFPNAGELHDYSEVRDCFRQACLASMQRYRDFKVFSALALFKLFPRIVSLLLTGLFCDGCLYYGDDY